MTAPDARRDATEPIELVGIPVSAGVAVGPIASIPEPSYQVEARSVDAGAVEEEVARFRRAVCAVRAEIEASRDAMREELGEEGAEIFEAQLLILADPLAIQRTESEIRDQRLSAEFVFRQNMLRVLDGFDSMHDGLFKERAADIRGVKHRVIQRLLPEPFEDPWADVGSAIVVARELSPGDLVALARTNALAIVTERGGPTSHAAIMARARRLPGVMGVSQLLEQATPARRAVVDGWRGRLILDPTPKQEAQYRRLERHYAEQVAAQEQLRELPSATTDGREVHLLANIEMPFEVDAVREFGSTGVGLLRTEFFLVNRSRLPTEEEQFRAYRSAVEKLAPMSIVIRTMDLGGDKFASYIGADRERNPFLGLRGIRFLLGHEEIFRTQLRAILRASAFGRVEILLPMVTTPEELAAARRHLDAVAAELSAAGQAYDENVRLGVMIETPSAVLMADSLARGCDFFSIGSNDLTQYALAVDRTNAKLNYLFNHYHPSVLRAIRRAVRAAHREACSVSVCGEMAGEPLATVLLVGLGVDELSMSPAFVPEIKQLVRSMSYSEARDIATRAVRLSTAAEVEELLAAFMRRRFPDLADVRGW